MPDLIDDFTTGVGGARPPTKAELAAMPVFNVAAFQKRMAAPLKALAVVETDFMGRYNATFANDMDQGSTGCCTGAGVAASVQWTALCVQNVALPPLSFPFAYYTDSKDAYFKFGSSVSKSAMNTMQVGICTDALFSAAYVLSTVNGWGSLTPAQLPQPGDAKYADAATRKTLQCYRLNATGDQRMTVINQLLAAGYAIPCASGNHAFALVAINSAGFYVYKDSKLGNLDMGAGRGCRGAFASTVRDSFYDICVIDRVDVSGPSFPPQEPPLTGNAMTIAAIKTLAAALVDPPTQAQKDQGIALFNALVIAGTTQPPPSGDSPERTVIDAPNGSIILGGKVWSWGGQGTHGGGTLILRDGVSAAGGEAVKMTNVGGQMWVLNALGDWYKWNGSGWPAPTKTAP